MENIAYFVLAGQSNVDNWFRDPSVLQTFKDEFLQKNPQYSDVQFFDCAAGGSAILGASAALIAEYRDDPDPAVRQAVERNHWYDEATHGDGPVLDQFEQQLASWSVGKEVLGIIWAQGEGDTAYVGEASAHDYKDGLVYVLDRLMDISGASQVFIQGLGDRALFSDRLHGGTGVIQQIQQELSHEFAWARLASTIFDLPLADGVHLTVEGYQQAAFRMAQAISTGLGSPTVNFGTISADGTIYIAIATLPGQWLETSASEDAFRLVGPNGTIEITDLEVDSAAGLVKIRPATSAAQISVHYASAEFSFTLDSTDLLLATTAAGQLPVHPFSLTFARSGVAISALEDGYRLGGTAAADVLKGFSGNDRLLGYEGDDTLIGGAGHDRMYGGLGNDTYYVNDSTDYAYENDGEGTDRVIASIDHQLRANVENLVLTGAAAIGKGNASDNNITGTASANRLYGFEGNDILSGGAGDDRMFGGLGNDTLTGGSGRDQMYGGIGDDRYIVGDSTDYAYENAGEGTDRVIASINHQLRANIEQLELSGTADLRGYGNALANVILGNSGNNLLYGRDGNDHVGGNAGNDILYGDNGNDAVDGGAGQDRFYGGAGADDFVFDDGDFAGMTSGTCDRIHDFSQAQGDQLRVSAVDANSALAGDQAFSFIGTASFTGIAGQLRYQQISGNTYVQGDVDGDGAADFWIRLDGLHTLQASDFII